VTVIPNFSRIAPVDAVRKPSIRPLHLISYGRLVRKKGFDVLLRALKTLSDGGVEATLIIGGRGPEAVALAALAQELGISEKVSIGVWIDDVAAALDEADVFVLPSRDEPFGIVMLEAMARGLPVVTTRTQGPLEVLTDNNAFFTDIGSVEDLVRALRQIAENPEPAAIKATAALELYRSTYHEDAVLPRFEALYRTVADA